MKKNFAFLLTMLFLISILIGCIGEDNDKDGIAYSTERNGWQITVYNIDGTMDKKIVKSDPEKIDTDNDGLNDKEEMNSLSDPTKFDTDGDGLMDVEEKDYGTSLIHFDTWIINLKGDDKRVFANYSKQGNLATQYDSDFDGLTDAEEYQKGSDPSKKDTDDDGDEDFIDPEPLWNLQVKFIINKFTLKKNMDVGGGANLYFVMIIGDETLSKEEVWDVSLNQEKQINSEYIVDFPDRNAYDTNEVKIRIAAYDEDNLFDDQYIGIDGSSEQYSIQFDIDNTEVTDFSTMGDEGNLNFSIEIIRT
jgi:hypothetical protein